MIIEDVFWNPCLSSWKIPFTINGRSWTLYRYNNHTDPCTVSRLWFYHLFPYTTIMAYTPVFDAWNTILDRLKGYTFFQIHPISSHFFRLHPISSHTFDYIPNIQIDSTSGCRLKSYILGQHNSQHPENGEKPLYNVFSILLDNNVFFLS